MNMKMHTYIVYYFLFFLFFGVKRKGVFIGETERHVALLPNHRAPNPDISMLIFTLSPHKAFFPVLPFDFFTFQIFF